MMLSEREAGIQKRLTGTLVSSGRNQGSLKCRKLGMVMYSCHTREVEWKQTGVGAGNLSYTGVGDHHSLHETLSQNTTKQKKKKKNQRGIYNKDTMSHRVNLPRKHQAVLEGPCSLRFTHPWVQAPTQPPSY